MQLDKLRQEGKDDWQHGSGGRGLLAAGNLNADPVFKAQTLISQLMSGQEHIVIEAHLDLSALPLLNNSGCGDGCYSPLPEVIKTKSIRGNCKGPPTEEQLAVLTKLSGTVGLLPMQEGQCLIIVPDDAIRTLTLRLWLDRLYIRAAYPHKAENPIPREYTYISGAVFEELQQPLRGQGRQYVTRSTFQGDGVGPAVGISASEDTYIENCTFANLGGDDASDGCTFCSGAIIAGKAAAVHIVNSTFFDPVRLPGTTYVRAWDSARVLISGCQFEFPSDVPDELFYTEANATIYTDDAAVRVRGIDGTTVDVLPASESPVQGSPKGSNQSFPRRTDSWFEYQVDRLIRRDAFHQELPQQQPAYPAARTATPLETGIPPQPATPAPLQPAIPAPPQPATPAPIKPPTPDSPQPSTPDPLQPANNAPPQPVTPAPPQPANPAPPPAGGILGVQPAVIAGVAAAGVLLLCVIAVCCAVWLRRRHRWSGQELGSKAMPVVGGVFYAADMTNPGGTSGTDGVSLPSGKIARVGSRRTSTEHTRAEELQGGPPARTLLEASALHRSTLPPSQVISTTASTDSRQAADLVHTAHARSAGGSVTLTSADVASLPDAFARHKPAATSSGPARARTMETVTDTCTYGMALKPQKKPEPGATMTDHMDFLHYQLDRLLDLGMEVLDGLVLEHGQSNRMQGGQAVIQFAKDRRSGLHYALKFFVSRDCFNDEAALYTNEGSPLGPFLPQLRNIAGGDGTDPAVVDPDGMPLPPCIVIEKGESLDVWMQRNRGVVDMVTGLQVIQHVAERLADLHSAGFVHRDLKLSNIMWLPRKNRWTLIDFGCAARSGEEAPVRYSLKYAAPEVVRAVSAGDRTIVAKASMDAWSLGVVAIELFCKRNAVDVLRSREQVFTCMLNNEPLPWEAGAKGTRALLRQLGIFQGAVLALLDRDAVSRLGVPDFIARCSSVLERTLGEEGPPEQDST